jgi:hypothetical protein
MAEQASAEGLAVIEAHTSTRLGLVTVCACKALAGVVAAAAAAAAGAC